MSMGPRDHTENLPECEVIDIIFNKLYFGPVGPYKRNSTDYIKKEKQQYIDIYSIKEYNRSINTITVHVIRYQDSRLKSI